MYNVVERPGGLTIRALGVPPMTTIAIPLSDERVAQLRLRAEQAGLAPEEFLRRRV